MFVKNLLMIPASSVAGIFMLIVAFSLIVPGSSGMNSPIISTTAQNIPKKLSNDINTVDSSNLIKSQIDLKTHMNVTSILDKYFIDLKAHLTVSCVLELENYKNDLETHLINQQNCQKNTLEIIKLNTKLKQQEEKISKIMKDLDKEKEKNQILLGGKTLLDNELSASLLENKGLNNQLSQLNNTCKQISQDKEQTLAECSEVNKKYTKSLETLITCDNRVLSLLDHQVTLANNLTILELEIKNITDEKNNTIVKMQHVIDSLESVISLKNRQNLNISLQLENKIDENKNIIQESIAMKKEQTEQLKAIEEQYQSNLTIKQQEVIMLKEIVFDINQKDLVESADLLKTLISIMKFNEDDVPDELLEKRRQLFQNKYNESQAVVVDDLRKRFDDIALTSTSQFFNKYFCNKKISYYNSTICECLSKKLNCYEIILSYRNLAVLPKNIFSGFENIKNLDLSFNQLYYLKSGTFNNLPNLQRLDLGYNKLTALPSDIFNGLEKLEELYLSSIELNSLLPGTFDNLSNLKILHIQRNYLTSLPKDIFKGLEKLEQLYLHANKLNTIQPGTFNNLPNLRNLLIYENYLSTHEHNILMKRYNFGNSYLIPFFKVECKLPPIGESQPVLPLPSVVIPPPP